MHTSSLYRSLRSSIRDNYLLLIIILLGLILRIYDIGGESLWLDEFISLKFARLDLGGIIGRIYYDSENNPPLYFMFLHYWIVLFGDSEASLRMTTVVFNTASIIVLYMLGRALFNKKTGLLASLIFSVSAYQIYYSQEARAYSLMVLLGLLSLLFLVRLMNKFDLRSAFGYVLFSGLLLYTHYYGLLIIAAENLYFFSIMLVRRSGKKKEFITWISLQVILSVLFVPGFSMLMAGHALEEGFWLSKPDLAIMFDSFVLYSGSRPLWALFSILSLFAIVYALVILYKNRSENSVNTIRRMFINNESDVKSIYLLLILIVVMTVIPYVVSHVYRPVYHDRYSILASSALYLLVAKGIDNIRIRRIQYLIVLLILVLSFFNIYEYYKRVDKHQWREAIEYIESEAGYGDVLMVYPPFESYGAGYYLDRKDLKARPFSDRSELVLDIGGKKLWIILSDKIYDGNVNQEALENLYRIIKIQEYKGLIVYLVADKAQ